MHNQTEHETMEIQEINPLEMLEVECDVVVNEDSPVWWFLQYLRLVSFNILVFYLTQIYSDSSKMIWPL